MVEAKLTTKHQITIPKAVREALDLQAGDRVNFAIEDRRVTMTSKTFTAKDLKGALPKPERSFTIEEIDELMKEAVAKDNAR